MTSLLLFLSLFAGQQARPPLNAPQPDKVTCTVLPPDSTTVGTYGWRVFLREEYGQGESKAKVRTYSVRKKLKDALNDCNEVVAKQEKEWKKR
jgi:hypothetical protein